MYHFLARSIFIGFVMQRKRLSLWGLLIALMLPASRAFGQTAGEWRVRLCVPNKMTVKLDTLSIRPESFSIADVSPAAYMLDPVTATVYLKDSALLGRVLSCRYQTFALDFSSPYAHKSTSLIERPTHRYTPSTTSTPLQTVADWQQNNQLLSSGSISRGVSVGNRQDLALNSTLNLQLSGKLSEDVSIEASITDKNIPIQPEGNTQYLHDINNIFITINIKDYLKLNAGDVLIQKPSSDFMNLSRNLLGLVVEGEYKTNTHIRTRHAIGGGVTKGSYMRQTITPQDGVQGPYRLYGKSNEINITIVAGSERVYVDGVLLTRGQENDYVIDYNTAEVTFTAAMLVTVEKRIVVEFEYSDRHYSRYSLFSYNTLTIGKQQKFTLDVNYFREQDLKNFSIQPELTDDQKRFLSLLPDGDGYAYYAQCDSAAFTADAVLYKRKDTLVDAIPYTVYVYSTSETEQLYRLSFTYMGQGRGSYRLLRSTANGRVFGWVAPENGELTGDYEPVVQLTTPISHQMLTLAGRYDFLPESGLRTELAVSHYDQNTFSKRDDRDNVGFAYLLDLHHRQKLGGAKFSGDDWTLGSSVNWQFVHRNFQAIERFREVEFARQYNLQEDNTAKHSEQMLSAEISIRNPRISSTRYALNWFSRFGDVSAIRQEIVSENTPGRWILKTRTSYLSTRDSIQKSQFWSSKNLVAFRLPKLEVGWDGMLEHNVFHETLTGALRANSYAFYENSLYVKSDSSAFSYQMYYKNRMESSPDSMRLRARKAIHEVSAQFDMSQLRGQYLSVRGTYRNQRLADSLSSARSEHYFVGNLEYTGRFFKNALILSTFYEIGSGMELRKTYTFLKVAAGQGTHVWVDYNGDGIEDIGEFEVAAFADEANYVKVWLAGTDYINTYNTQLTQSVQLRPAAVWRNSTGFRKFLSRFSDVAMLRTQQKHLTPNFNPFDFHLQDTNMVSRMLSVNNTFSFNNSASKFAFDFIVQKSLNKNLLYYGYEQASVDLQRVVLKSTPCPQLYLQTEYQHSITGNKSDYVQNRNYIIVSHQALGQLRWQQANRYQCALVYTYTWQRNNMGIERASTHDGTASFTYRSTKYGSAVVTVSYVHIQSADMEEGSVSYAMLKGLRPGHNALWGLSYQVPVSEFLQLSLQYDGRVSEGSQVVHTGQISVKAQF